MSSSQRETSGEQGPSPASSPLYLVENPLKSPYSTSDWRTYSEGGVFTGSMIHSLLGKVRRAVKGQMAQHHYLWWEMAIREENLRVQVPL